MKYWITGTVIAGLLVISGTSAEGADFCGKTTTPAEKFGYTSSRQRFACIGPLKRLGHSSIEILDEVDQRLMQLLDGGETGAFEQAPNQDAKPTLDLIEPGGMLRGIDKADPVVRIG